MGKPHRCWLFKSPRNPHQPEGVVTIAEGVEIMAAWLRVCTSTPAINNHNSNPQYLETNVLLPNLAPTSCVQANSATQDWLPDNELDGYLLPCKELKLVKIKHSLLSKPSSGICSLWIDSSFKIVTTDTLCQYNCCLGGRQTPSPCTSPSHLPSKAYIENTTNFPTFFYLSYKRCSDLD